MTRKFDVLVVTKVIFICFEFSGVSNINSVFSSSVEILRFLFRPQVKSDLKKNIKDGASMWQTQM